MKRAVKEALTIAALVLFTVACDDGDPCDKCDPWEECVDGKCVIRIDDAEEEEEEDARDEGRDGRDGVDEEEIEDGTGADGREVAPDGDEADGGDVGEEEEVCERTCETAEECNDDNVCTEDYCAPVTLCCTYFWEGLDFSPCGEDELYCNGTDYCFNRDCVHEDVECDEPGLCVATMECVERPDIYSYECVATNKEDGADCDDADPCTGDDNTCLDGNCQYENPCPLFTGNPCTHYVCDKEEDPICFEANLPDGQSCPDEDGCNGSEFCMDGECTLVVTACMDGDSCTGDVCTTTEDGFECSNPLITDCSYCDAPQATECDDDDDCTFDYCRVVGGEIECENMLNILCISMP